MNMSNSSPVVDNQQYLNYFRVRNNLPILLLSALFLADPPFLLNLSLFDTLLFA